MYPEINLLLSSRWTDYELLDSGDGQKLERFGPYAFSRPEVQALWKRGLPSDKWGSAHAVFVPSGEESGGHWDFRKKVAEKWEMGYPLSDGTTLRFAAMTTPGRHLGVFPECAAHWDWLADLIQKGKRDHSKDPSDPSAQAAASAHVLNLFGYTGLATLAAAAAGARVTHVDASRKSVSWARENQALSGLTGKPIRWIVDDALKFVEREGRRGAKYDGIILDPPKFGRGPKGEVWEIYQSLPGILQACRRVLNEKPLFIVLTVYAVKCPAIHLHQTLAEILAGLGGSLECGELVTREKSAGRLLSQAVYARWKPFGM
jgi:23S rRNA (cytosine1962-C5)-methyltransferase